MTSIGKICIQIAYLTFWYTSCLYGYSIISQFRFFVTPCHDYNPVVVREIVFQLVKPSIS